MFDKSPEHLLGPIIHYLSSKDTINFALSYKISKSYLENKRLQQINEFVNRFLKENRCYYMNFKLIIKLKEKTIVIENINGKYYIENILINEYKVPLSETYEIYVLNLYLLYIYRKDFIKNNTYSDKYKTMSFENLRTFYKRNNMLEY